MFQAILILFALQLPAKYPRIAVPASNPMSAAKVELGRYLFYDKRISGNGTQSCATCHRQELAFTDGRARALGSTGELHPRGSMSLVNVAYNASLTWADPTLVNLEDQAMVPMFGKKPVELGTDAPKFLAAIRADPTYQRLFPEAFPEGGHTYAIANVVKAIATFERTIVSVNTSYDERRLSPSAERGEVLYFSSERAGCFQCHGGWNLSGPLRFEGRENAIPVLHNTALSVDERGKFRAPTLRNIAVTAPYMHDGSVATMSDAIEHYAAGGRHPGNPNKSRLLRGFTLTQSEKQDLLEFLRSLTDDVLLHDPRFSDPWQKK